MISSLKMKSPLQWKRRTPVTNVCILWRPLSARSHSVTQLKRSPFGLRYTAVASYLLFSFTLCSAFEGSCLVGAGSVDASLAGLWYGFPSSPTWPPYCNMFCSSSQCFSIRTCEVLQTVLMPYIVSAAFPGTSGAGRRQFPVWRRYKLRLRRQLKNPIRSCAGIATVS